MHNTNAGKIETMCALPFSLAPRSPKQSLAHSPAPLCGTPRRNSARVSWAAGFNGQHCRALKLGQRRKTEDFAQSLAAGKESYARQLKTTQRVRACANAQTLPRRFSQNPCFTHSFIFTLPRSARAPHCAACRWQMPRSVAYCQSTRVFLCGLGYSFRRQPAPRAPPLARCSRGSGARFALTTRAPTLRYGKRNAHPSRVRENGIPTSSRGALLRASAFWGKGAPHAAAALGYSFEEMAHATAQTRRRSRPPLRGARNRILCGRTCKQMLPHEAAATAQAQTLPAEAAARRYFPLFALRTK